VPSAPTVSAPGQQEHPAGAQSFRMRSAFAWAIFSRSPSASCVCSKPRTASAGVGRGLGAPAPGRAVKLGVAAQHAPVVDRQRARVDVKREPDRFKLAPEVLVLRLVKIMTLGVIVDQGAAEPKIVDASAQLPDSRFGILHRQGRETPETVGMPSHDVGQEVVCVHGVIGRQPRVYVRLDPRHGQREDLQVDPVRVHLRYPVLGEVGQPKLASFRTLGGNSDLQRRLRLAFWQTWNREGLFQCDVLHSATVSGSLAAHSVSVRVNSSG
jgi:hypothetical protein